MGKSFAHLFNCPEKSSEIVKFFVSCVSIAEKYGYSTKLLKIYYISI